MEDQDLSSLSNEIQKLEKARNKKFTLYSTLMILLGLAIGTWSIIEGTKAAKLRTLNTNTQKQIDSLENKIVKAESLLASQQEKLLNNHIINGHIRSGLDFFYSRQYDLAIAEYGEAIKLDPQNFVLYDLQGYSMLRKKRYGEAIQSLQKSVQLNPDYAWGYYNLSLAYWASGDKDKAVQTVKQLLVVAPDFKKTISNDKQFAELVKIEEVRTILK